LRLNVSSCRVEVGADRPAGKILLGPARVAVAAGGRPIIWLYTLMRSGGVKSGRAAASGNTTLIFCACRNCLRGASGRPIRPRPTDSTGFLAASRISGIRWRNPAVITVLVFFFRFMPDPILIPHTRPGPNSHQALRKERGRGPPMVCAATSRDFVHRPSRPALLDVVAIRHARMESALRSGVKSRPGWSHGQPEGAAGTGGIVVQPLSLGHSKGQAEQAGEVPLRVEQRGV